MRVAEGGVALGHSQLVLRPGWIGLEIDSLRWEGEDVPAKIVIKRG